MRYNPSLRKQLSIKLKIQRICQGCGSKNVRHNDTVRASPSRIQIERYTCRECGHLSIYTLKEENWRVG